MHSTIQPRRRFLQSLAFLTAAGAGVRQASAAGALATDRYSSSGRTEPMDLPGFVDLQVNGFAGIDFNDPALSGDRIAEALEAMRRTGVTRCLPTLISSSFEHFAACARTLAQSTEPAVLGIHMEGPYISPEDGARGAHRREDVRAPAVDDFKRRQEAAGGRIRLVTLAPEVSGALTMIEHLVASGVRVAIGHTAAAPEQILDAVKAGATLSTHLGNGCAQMLPRHPNFLWEQLAADDLVASFIVDGHHLPPATVKAMVRAKTPARTVLVTDAMAAAGRPPGTYVFGNLEVVLDETGRVGVPGQPNLAGSALTMDVAVGNVARFAGVALEEAVAMASYRPAGYLNTQPAGRLSVDWDPVAYKLRVVKVTG